MDYTIVALTTFAASFVFIFLKAWQQKNVAFDHYLWIVPTSVLMAVVEVYVIANIATKGYSWWLVASVGVGSGLGALASAWLHNKVLKKK